MSVSAHHSNDSLITVDGSEFRRRVHREPQWCTADGWKGLSICAETEDSPHRQLLLQYPFEVKERGSTPHRQRPQISEARLAANIRQAVASFRFRGSGGTASLVWNPFSAGRNE